jgi:Na+-translocating ferredoxin:NAD+ oxidoreductase RNF subunit RnfB
MEILTPILILGFLGMIFGIGLAVASKKLSVAVDERLEAISALLPGANCGACGGAGCFGFAQGLLSGKFNVDACRAAEEESKEKIARFLGQSLDKKIKRVAVLHCNGGLKARDRFIYFGLPDCAAANLVLGGQKACVWGCLGFGDCQAVCPFGAIVMSRQNLPVVDESKCKACSKCVLACPKKLFTLISVAGKVSVACASRDLGKDTKSACPMGCIGCRLCERACKFQAIKVVDNLAAIDYHKCTSCGECVKVCPMKTISIR